MDANENNEVTREDAPHPAPALAAGSSRARPVRHGKTGNKGSAKTYSYADIQKLKDEWKQIGAGAVLGDTLYAKRAIRIAAREMADTILDVTMDRSEYVQSLIRGGFHRSTAFEIVKIAFEMAAERHEIAMRKIPSAAKHASTQSGSMVSVTATVPVASGCENEGKKGKAFPVAYSDPDGNWSDYVSALPDTLPKPSKVWATEYNLKEKKKISLKTVRSDLFGREFDKSLNGLAAITPGNALGRFNPNPIIGKYSEVWDGVGYFDVPPDVLAECLPYLAEEGLLEFHKVPLSAVLELEDLRQMYIRKGQIQAYDRDVRPGQKKAS